MAIKKPLLLLLPAIVGLIFQSCKKEITPTEPEPPVVERTTNQLVSDSVYYYFKEQSYWTSAVEDLNPISRFTDRHFSSTASLIDNARNVVNALKAQTPFHAGYNGAIDRFSFVEEVASSGNSARADNSDGYGIFESLARIDAADTAYIYISFVEGGSPAARANIRRGDKIIGINGDRNLAVPLVNGAPQNQRAIQLVAQALESSAFTIEVERAGEIHKHDLQYANYEIDPLITDTVYTIQGRKIGYFALSSFEQVRSASGVGTSFKANLDVMFGRFSEVEDIIVDFRYNVGGYVNAAQYLANYLINDEGDRKLMYKSETNPNLRRGIYLNQFPDAFFVKSSTLNPRKLYFLISNNTASASELVISALMAYYNPNGNNNAGSRRLEIIGTPLAVKPGTSIPSTYGKPMGFFPQTIMNRINLWAASFKIVNANGFTDYWDGIPATYPVPVQDNILYDFGDPRESMTNMALYHSVNNAYPTANNTQARAVRSSTENTTSVHVIKELYSRDPREMKKY